MEVDVGLGSWQSQRPIDRQNVTAIKFIDGGMALLGGTKDGVLYVPVDIIGVPELRADSQMVLPSVRDGATGVQLFQSKDVCCLSPFLFMETHVC